jgi:hypothetical protein
MEINNLFFPLITSYRLSTIYHTYTPPENPSPHQPGTNTPATAPNPQKTVIPTHRDKMVARGLFMARGKKIQLFNLFHR